MKAMSRYAWHVCAILAAAFALEVAVGAQERGNGRASQPITSGTIKQLVVPVDAVYKGMNYGEWSALWWQWIFDQPKEANPILQENGSVSMTEQSGPVYFLGGIWSGAFPEATRNATIPARTSLFFPVINGVFGNGGFVGTDVPEGWGPTDWSVGFLRAGVSPWFDNPPSGMYASLDGVPFPDLGEFRALSPAFATSGPETGDSIWMLLAPEGTDWKFQDAWPTVSDGYWLMLRPLPAGQHVLKFGQPGMDVTYNLNVLK